MIIMHVSLATLGADPNIFGWSAGRRQETGRSANLWRGHACRVARAAFRLPELVPDATQRRTGRLPAAGTLMKASTRTASTTDLLFTRASRSRG